MKELLTIQQGLKAPKGQRNSFGNYNYRSCEDIMEAVKPLLKSTSCVLIIKDEVVQVGERIYIKATALLTNADEKQAFAYAFAREPLTKKGMDEAQITGATSSYARKYALNGLFCIDDTKDADATNRHNYDFNKPQKSVVEKKKAQKEQQEPANKLTREEGLQFIRDYFKGVIPKLKKYLVEKGKIKTSLEDLQQADINIIIQSKEKIIDYIEKWVA